MRVCGQSLHTDVSPGNIYPCHYAATRLLSLLQVLRCWQVAFYGLLNFPEDLESLTFTTFHTERYILAVQLGIGTVSNSLSDPIGFEKLKDPADALVE